MTTTESPSRPVGGDASWSVVSGRTGHDVILQAFDAARRSVSLARCGQVGVFPGYDHLQLASTSGEEDGVVVITARAVGEGDRRHTVEYEACALQSGPDADRRVLARAIGRTLECSPAVRTQAGIGHGLSREELA